MTRARRVLVVDDSTETRAVIAESLAALGMEATQAENGRAALELFKEECPFDVVLADLAMPEMGGVQLANLLHQRFPGLPIIVMTGRDSQVEGSIDAGVLPLMKPFTVLQLKEVIDDMLG